MPNYKEIKNKNTRKTTRPPHQAYTKAVELAMTFSGLYCGSRMIDASHWVSTLVSSCLVINSTINGVTCNNSATLN